MELYGRDHDIDVMIEAKAKERALICFRDGLPIPEVRAASPCCWPDLHAGVSSATSILPVAACWRSACRQLGVAHAFDLRASWGARLMLAGLVSSVWICLV